MQLSIDPFPVPCGTAFEVPAAQYHRHLGLPVEAEISPQLYHSIQLASDWFQKHAKPWLLFQPVMIENIDETVVQLENCQQLISSTLAEGLAYAGAQALVVVAVSAGNFVDQRITSLWQQDRPDDAMFLNAYGIAAVEHLRQMCGDHLSHTLGKHHFTVLPHYSPGYEGWGLDEQHKLYALIEQQMTSADCEMTILSSGCLQPNKSTLTVYGITRQSELRTEPVAEYWALHTKPESKDSQSKSRYDFPEKVLERWRHQRLTMKELSCDRMLATFRFDGTTCTNMGIPLVFIYQVELHHHQQTGYRIVDASCQPAADHRGHQSMCAYLDNPDQFMGNLNSHISLVGRRLREVLAWQQLSSPAGCLCTRSSQNHKWKIVLQTIHYALENK